MTMPLLTAMPVRMMKPMMAPMLMVVPVMKSSTTTPMKPRGMVNMLIRGKSRFSYSEAMTAKTSTRAISRAKRQGGEGLGHVLILSGLLDEIAFRKG